MGTARKGTQRQSFGLTGAPYLTPFGYSPTSWVTLAVEDSTAPLGISDFGSDIFWHIAALASTSRCPVFCPKIAGDLGLNSLSGVKGAVHMLLWSWILLQEHLEVIYSFS